jgi:TPR repeat protein
MGGCNNLGFLYYKGHGVSEDRAQARTLWTRACDGGVQNACTSLRRTE